MNHYSVLPNKFGIGGKKLVGIQGGESIIKIYYERKNIFNKREKDKKKNSHVFT